MPKITIKYEHPHELTDLLGKLMQMYVVPEAICGTDDSQGATNSKDNSAFIADTDNQLFTLDEAAEYLEVDMTTFCRMLADGVLKAKGFKVPLSELRKFKEKLGK